MTNNDKRYLRQLARRGLSLEKIRGLVTCSDSTIREYIKIFGSKDK